MLTICWRKNRKSMPGDKFMIIREVKKNRARKMDLNTISDFLTSVKWAIAGFFGALVSARFHKDKIKNKMDYVMFLVSGVLIANYLTGLVATYLQFDPGTAGGIGFLLGAFGGSLMQAVIKAITSADLWVLVKKRLGGE